MRTVLDGSFLALPPSGTGTYLRELTRAMVALDPSLDLTLIAPGRPVLRPHPRSADAVTWPAMPTPGQANAGGHRVRRLAWDMVGVAREARRQRAILLHIPHFSAPIWSPRPLVVTIHDAIPLLLPAYRSSRGARLRLAIARRTVHQAALVLTPSHAAARDIERLLAIPAERIRVTPEAAGPEYQAVEPENASEVRDVARRFGVFGRYIFNASGLDVRKNLPVLLEAFARIQSHLEAPIHLVIAGAPHTTNRTIFPPLAPEIEQRGLQDRVVLTGFVSDADKLALYQGAAIYATPSLAEGFGLTVLEAMACGVPVIAANRTSLPEVVGDAGLLVEPDGAAFADALLAVLNRPDRAATLRERGLTRAATFSWERTARLTLNAYREAISGQDQD